MRQILVFVCAVAVGCSSTAGVNRCTPGEVLACPCAPGARGVQACQPGGTFSACLCPDAASPADGGGDAALDARGDVLDGPALDGAEGAPPDAAQEAAADAPAQEAAADASVDLGADAPCASGATACGATCVDLSRDPQNCGRCGRDCSALPGVISGAVRCVAGECDVAAAC